jgi:uncharacterized protein YjdB
MIVFAIYPIFIQPVFQFRSFASYLFTKIINMKTVKFMTMMFAIAIVIASCKDSDDAVAVSGVTVEPTSLSLVTGETSTLVATVSPDDANDKTVTWSSDNEEVATVGASTGVVTAVSAGTATITVTTTDGAKTDVCEVTVSNNTDDEGEGGEEA